MNVLKMHLTTIFIGKREKPELMKQVVRNGYLVYQGIRTSWQ